MKFQLIYSDDDNYHHPQQEPKHIEGAFSEIEIKQEWQKLYEITHNYPEAVINDQGKPVIVYKKEIKLEPRDYYQQRISKEKWESIGFNHQYLEDRWTRDQEVTTWWIKIDNLEEFVNFSNNIWVSYEDEIFYWRS